MIKNLTWRVSSITKIQRAKLKIKNNEFYGLVVVANLLW